MFGKLVGDKMAEEIVACDIDDDRNVELFDGNDDFDDLIIADKCNLTMAERKEHILPLPTLVFVGDDEIQHVVATKKNEMKRKRKRNITDHHETGMCGVFSFITIF